MKRVYGFLTGVVLAIGACKGDPTSSLRNGPASLTVKPNTFVIDTGQTEALVITIRDAQLNPVAGTVTVTSANQTIAKVVRDTTLPPVDSSKASFQVTALSPGQTKLMVNGAGVIDSAVVNVLSVAFTGVLSSTTPKAGDTLTIHSTVVLKFAPESALVIFGGSAAPDTGTILIATADSLKVLAPVSGSAPLSIKGIVLPFISGSFFTLPTPGSVAVTGDHWAADNSWQTAPDITALLPAAGGTSHMVVALGQPNVAVCPEGVLGFGSSGPCMIFKFTVASPTTLNFATLWQGTGSNPDIDIYACSDSAQANFGAACFEDGGAGATGSDPQATGNFAYPAGTHCFVIEYFAAGDGATCATSGNTKNYVVTITRP
jgi:hypothetical protein